VGEAIVGDPVRAAIIGDPAGEVIVGDPVGDPGEANVED